MVDDFSSDEWEDMELVEDEIGLLLKFKVLNGDYEIGKIKVSFIVRNIFVSLSSGKSGRYVEENGEIEGLEEEVEEEIGELEEESLSEEELFLEELYSDDLEEFER